MMEISKLFFCIFAFCVLLLPGCGKSPPIHFYTVDIPEYSNNAGADSKADFKITVGVKRFDAGLLYRDDKIIFRETKHEIKFWNYHRWIAPPHILLTEAFRANLARSNLFENVLHHPSSLSNRYYFEGQVKSFEEVDENDKWFGKVGFEIKLVDTARRRVIWRRTFVNKVAAESKLASAVVKAINEAMETGIQQAITELRQTLQLQ